MITVSRSLAVIAMLLIAIAIGGVDSWADGAYDQSSVVRAEFVNDFGELFEGCDQIFEQSADECDAIRAECSGGVRGESDSAYELLPDGLLWHSYLAGPNEPRISTVLYNDDKDGKFWDATLGGRVGLIRFGPADVSRSRAWQWDLEGAVMTRLDLLHAEDVESMNYRFGTEITTAKGPWAMKFGYFHISAHVGDEYMIRNPLFRRVNYVTESWVWGASYTSPHELRFYGEMANAFRASGGAKRYQFQTGVEYSPIARDPWCGAPFAAVHLNFRQAVDYQVSTTVQCGWAFLSPESGRRLRFGFQYADGPTSQYEFFSRRESYFGMGVWFDY